MLMRPKKVERAVHGCHLTGNRLWACVQGSDRRYVLCDHVIQMVDNPFAKGASPMTSNAACQLPTVGSGSNLISMRDPKHSMILIA